MLEALIVELPVRVSVPLLVSTLVEPPPYTVRLVAVLLFPPVASIALVPVRFTAPNPVSVTTAGLPTTFNEPMFNIAVLLSVPPVRFAVFTDAAAPRFKLPEETVTSPDAAPFKAPLNVALPVPETVSPPPSVVMPNTVKEPPETLRELPLLILNAAIVSVPVVCVTA